MPLKVTSIHSELAFLVRVELALLVRVESGCVTPVSGKVFVMRDSFVKFILAALAMGSLFLASVPSAWANSVSFNLTANNLGISGSIGDVTVTDTGANQVTVTLTMNAGFSIKLQGGDIAFSGPSGLTAGSVGGLTAFSGANTFSGLSFKQFFTPKNISQFGAFAFDYANIKGSSNGVVSADSLTFVLTAPGLTASQFTGVAIHFCTASGTSCGPLTGFASSGPVSTVPEPGSMTLLVSGLVGLGGLVRRRM